MATWYNSKFSNKVDLDDLLNTHDYIWIECFEDKSFKVGISCIGDEKRGLIFIGHFRWEKHQIIIDLLTGQLPNRIADAFLNRNVSYKNYFIIKIKNYNLLNLDLKLHSDGSTKSGSKIKLVKFWSDSDKPIEKDSSTKCKDSLEYIGFLGIFIPAQFVSAETLDKMEQDFFCYETVNCDFQGSTDKLSTLVEKVMKNFKRCSTILNKNKVEDIEEEFICETKILHKDSIIRRIKVKERNKEISMADTCSNQTDDLKFCTVKDIQRLREVVHKFCYKYMHHDLFRIRFFHRKLGKTKKVFILHKLGPFTKQYLYPYEDEYNYMKFNTSLYSPLKECHKPSYTPHSMDAYYSSLRASWPEAREKFLKYVDECELQKRDEEIEKNYLESLQPVDCVKNSVLADAVIVSSRNDLKDLIDAVITSSQNNSDLTELEPVNTSYPNESDLTDHVDSTQNKSNVTDQIDTSQNNTNLRDAIDSTSQNKSDFTESSNTPNKKSDSTDCLDLSSQNKSVLTNHVKKSINFDNIFSESTEHFHVDYKENLNEDLDVDIEEKDLMNSHNITNEYNTQAYNSDMMDATKESDDRLSKILLQCVKNISKPRGTSG